MNTQHPNVHEGRPLAILSNNASCIPRSGLLKFAQFVGIFAALTATSLQVMAQSEKFPDKPIRIIVPFAAGGPTDIVGRVLGESLAKKLGQPVVIDNRAGAGGAIGAEAIAAAPADGYTIGMVTISTHVVNPSCNKNLKYNPITSFTPIALVADMPNIYVARKEFKANTFKEFREVMKSKSEQHSLGTAGNCSYGHVMLEHLNQELGAKIAHIPYKGSALAVNDLLGGSLDLMGDTYPLLGPHIESGKLKALAVAWPTRLPYLPDVPTFDELGVSAMSVTSWYGIVAPANMPKARLDILSQKISESMREADLQQRFAKAGIAPVQNSSPEQFKTFLIDQFKKQSAFIQSRNMSSQ